MQKGIIQIPSLIAVIIAIMLIFGGTSLYFYNQKDGIAQTTTTDTQASSTRPVCEPEIVVKEVIKPIEVIVEVIKEVPIEKIVEKIVYIDKPIIQECPVCLNCGEEEPYIILVDIDTSETSAEIRWQTTLPTISTMFLWKEGDESFDVFNYNSYTNKPSTRHKVVVEHLEPNQKYIGEIEAVLGQKTAKTKINFITIQE